MLIFGCKCRMFNSVAKLQENLSQSSNENVDVGSLGKSFSFNSVTKPPALQQLTFSSKNPSPPKPVHVPTRCNHFTKDIIHQNGLVVFVDITDGKRENSGESWEKAVDSINAALGIIIQTRIEKKSKGQSIERAYIAVAKGEYTYAHENEKSSLGNRKEIIALYGHNADILSDISISGGFLSKDECFEVTQNDNYEKSLRETILDAGENASVIAIAEAKIKGIEISNFTLTGGFAKAVNGISAKKDGGAISLRGNGLTNLTFSDLIITNSKSEQHGGAIAITGTGIGVVKINNLTITNNEATKNGGAIFAQSGKIAINSIKINNNKASLGGGLYITNKAKVTLVGRDNAIKDNTISLANGAGVYIDSDKKQSFSNLTVENNISSDRASAGLGFYINNDSAKVTLNKTEISGHKNAVSGAGIYANATATASLVLNDVTMKNNKVTTNGGAIFLNNTPTTFGAFLCESNEAQNGGCIHSNVEIDFPAANIDIRKFIGNKASANGGAIYSTTISNIAHSSFSGNEALNGAAIYALKDTNIVLGNALFLKNIATNNGGAIFFANVNNSISLWAMGVESVESENKIGKEQVFVSKVRQTSEEDINSTKQFSSNITRVMPIFKDNTAQLGGAIYASNNLQIIGSYSFFEPKEIKEGGLTYKPDFSYNLPLYVEDNKATDGAGIYVTNKLTQVGHIEYRNNSASNNGGAIYVADTINSQLNGNYYDNKAVNGAAVYAVKLKSNLKLFNVTNNNASETGGGLYVENLANNPFISNIYSINGNFSNNTANQASVVYLDKSNAYYLSFDGNYIGNKSAASPIFVINDHTNMSLAFYGDYRNNNEGITAHNEIITLAQNVKNLSIGGAFISPSRTIRSVAGSAFGVANISGDANSTLSIAGGAEKQISGYQTTESGGFLTANEVNKLNINNPNFMFNKAELNGGAIAIAKVAGEASTSKMLASDNEAKGNGGVLYIGQANSLIASNPRNANGSLSFIFENKYMHQKLNFPKYKIYELNQNTYNRSQFKYFYNELNKLLKPFLNNFSKDVNIYNKILKLLTKNKYADFNTLKTAVVGKIRTLLTHNIEKELKSDPNYNSLSAAKKQRKLDKKLQPYFDNLLDTAKPITDLIAQKNEIMSKYSDMIKYMFMPLENDNHYYYENYLTYYPLQNNKAKNGGVLSIDKVGNVDLQGLAMQTNNASENGGAINLNEVNGNLIIKESLFEKNNSQKLGGTLFASKITGNIVINNTRTTNRPKYISPYFDIDGYNALTNKKLSSIHFSLTNDIFKINNDSLFSTILINNNTAQNNASGGFAYINEVDGNLDLTDAVLLDNTLVIPDLTGVINQTSTNIMLNTNGNTDGVITNKENINATAISP